VFAQDEGGEGLVGYADVQVNLKDINDNAPIFPQGVYFGNVTENGTAGLWPERNRIRNAVAFARSLPRYNHADITFPRAIQQPRDVELGDFTPRR